MRNFRDRIFYVKFHSYRKKIHKYDLYYIFVDKLSVEYILKFI